MKFHFLKIKKRTDIITYRVFKGIFPIAYIEVFLFGGINVYTKKRNTNIRSAIYKEFKNRKK